MGIFICGVLTFALFIVGMLGGIIGFAIITEEQIGGDKVVSVIIAFIFAFIYMEILMGYPSFKHNGLLGYISSTLCG